MKLAGAPISWGVCEVPDWGYQLAPERVLGEMQGAGLVAAEFGPEGFLPAEPGELGETLARYGLAPVGAFAPVVLHRDDHDPEPAVAELLDTFAVTHADVLVLAAATGAEGYDSRPELDEKGWTTLLRNLDRLADLAAARGVRAVLHPHVGTMIEQRDEVFRVLTGSSIGLCLDTGHLLIGGTDPIELVEAAAARIGHVHVKDVDARIAARVRTGALTYTEAVRRGLYRPLGDGDVDIAGVVARLDAVGYEGWYVLEQDTILDAEPAGVGPLADVERSIAYLLALRVSL